MTCGERGLFLKKVVELNLESTSSENRHINLKITDEELQNLVKCFTPYPKAKKSNNPVWKKIVALDERRKGLGENILKLTDDQLEVLKELLKSSEVKSFENKLEGADEIIFKFLYSKILSL